MKLNRVLVVIKSQPPDPSHAQSLAAVEEALRALKTRWRIIVRERCTAEPAVDLIIPVGGDGTFLAAAHAAGRVPLLGVNAAPAQSVGFFCAARAETVEAILDRISRNRIRPRQLPLIETRINGKALPCLALNDVLFAGESPAETVRYRLAIDGRSELQKSSGLWIAAGPGSTAAIRSAGGRRMPIASQRLQYLVREPCPIPGRGYRLVRGVLAASTKLTIVSEMKSGEVFLDGHWHSYRVAHGASISCRIARRTLSVFL